MKKLLRKRSLFLVALLVSLCIPTVLRAGVIDEGEVEGKVYYIRNATTGLYVKYGGAWGTDAVEGRAAHPFKLLPKGNGIYALGSIRGYFNSKYSDASLYMDRVEAESNWTLLPVANPDNGVYYLLGEGGRALASAGSQYGVLELRPFDKNDIMQRWELITKDELMTEMETATADAPVDVTPLIKGAAFDYADLLPVAEGSPFWNEIYALRTTTWNSTSITSAGTYEAWVLTEDVNNDGEYDRWEGDEREWRTLDHENVDWKLEHAYINHWDGFKRMEQYNWMDRWTDLNTSGENVNGIGISRNNVHHKYVIRQNLGTLPAGTYKFSFQGFYACITEYSSRTHSIPVKITGTQGTTSVSLLQNVNLPNYTSGISHDFIAEGGTEKGRTIAAMFRDNRENASYRVTKTITLDAETKDVTIEIEKPETDVKYGGSKRQWLIAFDDFTLVYYGEEPESTDFTDLYYEKVKAAHKEALDKVNALDDTGLTCSHSTSWQQTLKVTFDHNNKIAKLNSNNIDTEKEYLEALANIEAAYQAALAAHKQAIMDKTDDNDEVPDVPFISNHSFETGDLTGWTVGSTGAQIAVFPKANGTYATDDTDGDYLFNSFAGDDNTFTPWIKQEITGLKNGLYKLQALLTSFEGNHVYLIGNNYHDYIVADGKTTFKEATLYFLVENGKATIGAIGGHHRLHNRTHDPVNGKHLFDCYYPGGGCFFKADNFRLTYICDVPNGKLRLALNEASKANLDEYGQASIASTITEYEKVYLERKATDGENGNVGDYVTTIHNALNTAAKAQKTIGADMTYAIKNPNFEWDWKYGGWTCETGNDTGIKEQEHGTFTTAGADGRFLFNTWDGGTAKPLKQTIDEIPNGRYVVSAMLATDGSDDDKGILNSVVLIANTTSMSAKTYAGGTAEYVEVVCDVTENKLVIEAIAQDQDGNKKWFKADDFHLTLLLPTDDLVLNQDYEELPEINGTYKSVTVKRSITAGNWSTFVVPFQIPEDKIKELDWDVRELVSSRADEPGEDNKRNITLTFKKVSAIKAGVPYMVMVPEENENVTEFVVSGSVAVNTTDYKHAEIKGPDATEVDDVKFIGTYTKSVVPGNGKCYIVSKNLYKRVPETYTNGKEIKGFRAYIELLDKTGDARSMSYRWGEGETAIDSANNDELTVVAIYNLNGVRLDDMQEGINILRMSDGSTMKVIIK